MKSKATRGGDTKTNEVHKNIVHEENLRKEYKYIDKNRMENF
jgi:hypothetical protein